jgi:acyl-CoA thioesterase-1
MLCLMALTAALYGCGREAEPQSARRGKPAAGPKAASPEQSTPPAAPDKRPIIECFGDSLTAGFGVDPGNSYPDVLQRELSRNGYYYRVVNLGVSGDTSQDGLARIGMALEEKPALVVLEFGANDGLRGIPVAITEKNLARVIEEFQKADVRVVLAGMTLPPNYGPEYIRRFEGVYRDLAAKYHVPLIPFLLEGVGGNPALMQQDGLHPNAEGTRRVAMTVFRAVAPLLRKS